MARYKRKGLPVVYVPSVNISKEALVRRIAAEHPRRRGPLTLLRCVELCRDFTSS